MSDQTYHDATTGQFVSPDYAAEHPDTTVTVTSHPAPVDRLADTLASITALTDSQVSWSGVLLGVTRTGTSPEDIADQLLQVAQSFVDAQEVTL